MQPNAWRKTSQYLAPTHHMPTAPGHYDIYPGFPVGGGKITVGYAALAKHLAKQHTVILDGYGGVFWDVLRERLDAALRKLGVSALWHDVSAALRPEPEIDKTIGR